jgi:iron-sulfur cluster assembly protein
VLTVTPTAETKLKEALEKMGVPEASVRIYVAGGCGCGNTNFGMSADTDGPAEQDEIIEFNGVKVLLDPQAQAMAVDATVDFIEGEMSSGFRILRAGGAGGGCGCGGGGAH